MDEPDSPTPSRREPDPSTPGRAEPHPPTPGQHSPPVDVDWAVTFLHRETGALQSALGDPGDADAVARAVGGFQHHRLEWEELRSSVSGTRATDSVDELYALSNRIAAGLDSEASLRETDQVTRGVRHVLSDQLTLLRERAIDAVREVG